MCYEQEFIEDLIPRLTTPGGDAYVEKMALAVGKALEKDLMLYKGFGGYIIETSLWCMKI